MTCGPLNRGQPAIALTYCRILLYRRFVSRKMITTYPNPFPISKITFPVFKFLTNAKQPQTSNPKPQKWKPPQIQFSESRHYRLKIWWGLGFQRHDYPKSMLTEKFCRCSKPSWLINCLVLLASLRHTEKWVFYGFRNWFLFFRNSICIIFCFKKCLCVSNNVFLTPDHYSMHLTLILQN